MKKGKIMGRQVHEKFEAWRQLIEYNKSNQPKKKGPEEADHLGLDEISDFCLEHYDEIMKNRDDEFVANIALFGEAEAEAMKEERDAIEDILKSLQQQKKLYTRKLLMENRETFKSHGIIVDDQGRILEGKEKFEAATHIDEKQLNEFVDKFLTVSEKNNEEESEKLFDKFLQSLGHPGASAGLSLSSSLNSSAPAWTHLPKRPLPVNSELSKKQRYPILDNGVEKKEDSLAMQPEELEDEQYSQEKAEPLDEDDDDNDYHVKKSKNHHRRK